MTMTPERRGAARARTGAPTPPPLPAPRVAPSDPHIPRTPSPHGSPSAPQRAVETDVPVAAAPAAPVATSVRAKLLERARALSSSPRRRRGLVVAAVVLELVALAGVVAVGLDSSVEALVRPASSTGTVHDVGVGGVNLRSAPQVATSTARGIALDGTPLAIECGVTGATVSGPASSSPLWFRTTDDKYVSMLYVTIPGRAFVPSCGASADAPLVAVVDPDAAAATDVPLSAGPDAVAEGPGDPVVPGVAAGSRSTRVESARPGTARTAPRTKPRTGGSGGTTGGGGTSTSPPTSVAPAPDSSLPADEYQYEENLSVG